MAHFGARIAEAGGPQKSTSGAIIPRQFVLTLAASRWSLRSIPRGKMRGKNPDPATQDSPPTLPDRFQRYVKPPGAKLWFLGGPDVCAGRRRLVPGCARLDFRPHVRSVPGQRVDAQTPGEHSLPARTRPLSRSRGLQASLRPQVCLTAAGWQASRLTGSRAGRSLALRSCAPTLLHVFSARTLVPHWFGKQVCGTPARGLRGVVLRPFADRALRVRTSRGPAHRKLDHCSPHACSAHGLVSAHVCSPDLPGCV